MQVTSIQPITSAGLQTLFSSVGEALVGIQVTLTDAHPNFVKSVIVSVQGAPLYYCSDFEQTPLPPVHAVAYQTLHCLPALLRSGFQFKSIKDPFIAGDMMQYTLSTKDPFSSLCRDILPAVYADAATSIKALESNADLHPPMIEAACVVELYQEVVASLLKDRSQREQTLVLSNLEAQAATNLLLAKGSCQGFPVDKAKMQAAAEKIGEENASLDHEIVTEIRGHMGWPDPFAKPENSLF